MIKAWDSKFTNQCLDKIIKRNKDFFKSMQSDEYYCISMDSPRCDDLQNCLKMRRFLSLFCEKEGARDWTRIY